MPEHLYTKVGHMYCAAGFLTSVMHKCLRNIYPNDWASRKPPLSYSLKWHPGKSEKKGGQPKTGGRPERLGTQKKILTCRCACLYAYNKANKPHGHLWGTCGNAGVRLRDKIRGCATLCGA